ncbi:transglycosylase domain-containing protein [Ethanoligenens harbinense]|uniref:Penicillin-binding protein 1A n=1 Tax=Ethanoligenens harbinense (strain DSM 18485 / JCM 12961 / CGMCC 1.5033 / YUAN-3) TaxID=663278 RepID=E6U8C4_ETHHY|nr:transglycosylase domain-containing protein [Ethanoligenens harbinense]ADU28243.1 Peptidoglycan glycosyltransferase [Ethanoligenens harbinense YUAN-3]AVQ97238.1 penicillin-binding protein [Ethanoligenens harbinense YUAN-3]AYF39903.1 penicillin-binding protein [Ethanoligenens harbinense]AYF42733.1 penicillin-binding protein [Ethanoligenens harbinense]QCN93483.1 penicillin-binding protein [Ethanoligenens harbinense]
MKAAGNNRPPASKKAASGSKKTERHVANKIGKVFLTLFLLVVITGSIVVGTLAVYILVFVKPENIDLTNAQLKFTSMIYANDSSGNPQLVSQINGGENRIWVSIDQMPDNLKNAFISTEDQRFYEHEGVDWKRTIGAFANFFLHFYSTDQGGSTITQQLIKNINGDTYNRKPGVKIAEIVTALNLEKKFSKDQILESYLNTIPLGGSSYGVEAASESYFGKSAKDLDLAQCAVLAGLTQAPNSYNPLKHPDKAKTRQAYVLKNMLDQKMITQAQYNQALAEPLTYVGQQPAIRSWFVDQVINDVIDDLVTQKGYMRTRATSMVLNGGLKIYSTLNPTVQTAMDNVYQTNANSSDIWLAGKNGTYQSAMVIMDYSGAVLGLEGARGAKTTNLGFSRATDMLRSPGSSIKPIGVYGPAIEQGLISWSSTFQDSPPITLNGSPWPHNDDSWSYQTMTVPEALAQSKNTIAVRIEQLVKPATTVNFLTNKLGFTTLVTKADKNGNSDMGLAVGIGSLTKGVSVETMAAAYQPFGDGGLYNKPYTYTKVLDSNGNVLLENKATGTRAFSQETSTIVNRLLQNDVTNGTGVKAQLSSTTVGGKTGTTDNGWDRWFVGITPDYVGATWCGYDDNKEMYTRDNPSVIAWHAVMQKIQSALPYKTFPVWGDVVQGADGGWYKAGTQPQ